MTEKEKMLAGLPYSSMEEGLTEERQAARALVHELNNLHPFQLEKRDELLRKLLGGLGADYTIELPFRCDYGYNITIGDRFYANFNCTILDCAPVTIGNDVLFAPNVSLFTAGHPIHCEPRNQGVEYSVPIVIGDGVWVGGNTVINPGVSVGSNVVIGSGSVVTKDIPSGVVAAGNPCRVIREITGEDKQYYYKKRKIESHIEST